VVAIPRRSASESLPRGLDASGDTTASGHGAAPGMRPLCSPAITLRYRTFAAFCGEIGQMMLFGLRATMARAVLEVITCPLPGGFAFRGPFPESLPRSRVKPYSRVVCE